MNGVVSCFPARTHHRPRKQSCALFVGDDDGTGDYIGTFKGHKGCIWCGKLDHDGVLALTASADFTWYVHGGDGDVYRYSRLWDAVNGNCIHIFEDTHVLKACDIHKVCMLSIFSDIQGGDRIAYGGQNKNVHVHAIESKSKIHTYDNVLYVVTVRFEFEKTVRAIQLLPNNMLAAGGDDMELKIWDMRSNTVAMSSATMHPITDCECEYVPVSCNSTVQQPTEAIDTRSRLYNIYI